MTVAACAALSGALSRKSAIDPDEELA